MKKLCVIGNSQVGALKVGYDNLENKYYNASFWSMPGGRGPTIQIENNKIAVSQEVLQKVKTDILPPGRELNLSSFDAVLLSGVGVFAIRKQYNAMNRKLLVAGFIDNRMPIDRQVVSRALFTELLENELRNLPCFKNIDKVESIFHKKIYIQQSPMPTPNVADQADFDLPYGRNLGSFLSWYHNQQSQIIEKHIKGKNIELIKYPKEWIEAGFTPIHYKNQNDAWHLNAKFGELFMRLLMREDL